MSVTFRLMAVGLIHLLYKQGSSYNMNNMSLIEDNESNSQTCY